MRALSGRPGNAVESRPTGPVTEYGYKIPGDALIGSGHRSLHAPQVLCPADEVTVEQVTRVCRP